MSSPELILRPSGLEEKHNKPWSLQLRYGGMPETQYVTLARVSDDTAQEIMKAGAPSWLFGEPNWDERLRKRALEHARQLEEQAKAIRAEAGA
jgi:hypothetical protein